LLLSAARKLKTRKGDSRTRVKEDYSFFQPRVLGMIQPGSAKYSDMAECGNGKWPID
jgi:hypothetical protein